MPANYRSLQNFNIHYAFVLFIRLTVNIITTILSSFVQIEETMVHAFLTWRIRYHPGFNNLCIHKISYLTGPKHFWTKRIPSLLPLT